MNIIKTKTEQVENGWVGKLYQNGILIYTTEVFETEQESKEAAVNKSVEIQQ